MSDLSKIKQITDLSRDNDGTEIEVILEDGFLFSNGSDKDVFANWDDINKALKVTKKKKR